MFEPTVEEHPDSAITLRFWPAAELDTGALEALTRLAWRPFVPMGETDGKLVFVGRGRAPAAASQLMYDILLELVMLTGVTAMADCSTSGPERG